jgi:hypothetical protein
MFVGLYYPAMTESDDMCDQGDEVGTGTVGCAQTLSCMGSCPADGDPSENNGYGDCEQKCMVNSCPGAAAPLSVVASCIEQNCAAACGIGDAGASAAAEDAGSGGGPSAACTSCVTTSCASQYGACLSAPCSAE